MAVDGHCAARRAHVKMGSMESPSTGAARAWLRRTGRAALLLGAAYVLLVAMIAFLQRSLIYQPMTAPLRELEAEAHILGLGPWAPHPDHSQFGWQLNKRPPGTGILILHGNAGFALHRAPIARRLAAHPGIGAVVILEYPGYGFKGVGAPSEIMIMHAARLALRALHDASGGPVLVAGESLGSAFAAQVAAERPELVRGLLLITPMNRLRDVAAHHFPVFPVRWMLRERMDAEAALTGCRIPLALVIAEHDEVIPPRLGLRLLEVTQGPARAWTVPGAFHNTLPIGPGQGPWDEALAFLLEAPPLP
jgi:pimeloyl-ACP methyl ester carboxylesterase